MTAVEYLEFFADVYDLEPGVRAGRIAYLLEYFGLSESTTPAGRGILQRDAPETGAGAGFDPTSRQFSYWTNRPRRWTLNLQGWCGMRSPA